MEFCNSHAVWNIQMLVRRFAAQWCSRSRVSPKFGRPELRLIKVFGTVMWRRCLVAVSEKLPYVSAYHVDALGSSAFTLTEFVAQIQ